MNIIRVIVDHLPESCNICPFSLPEQDALYFCCARNVLTEEYELSIKNMVDKRPYWCPLVTENDANICNRCGKTSRKHMTVIPEGFKNSGQKICDACIEEVWGFIMDFDKDAESEEK